MVVYSIVVAQPEILETCGRKMRWKVNEAEIVFMRVKIALSYINDRCNFFSLILENVPEPSLNA
jgi:hypothetical protein